MATAVSHLKYAKYVLSPQFNDYTELFGFGLVCRQTPRNANDKDQKVFF